MTIVKGAASQFASEGSRSLPKQMLGLVQELSQKAKVNFLL